VSFADFVFMGLFPKAQTEPLRVRVNSQQPQVLPT